MLKDASDGDLEAFLYTRLLQVRLTRTGFPAGGFHSFRVGYFFVEGKVRLKEKD